MKANVIVVIAYNQNRLRRCGAQCCSL